MQLLFDVKPNWPWSLFLNCSNIKIHVKRCQCDFHPWQAPAAGLKLCGACPIVNLYFFNWKWHSECSRKYRKQAECSTFMDFLFISHISSACPVNNFYTQHNATDLADRASFERAWAAWRFSWLDCSSFANVSSRPSASNLTSILAAWSRKMLHLLFVFFLFSFSFIVMTNVYHMMHCAHLVPFLMSGILDAFQTGIYCDFYSALDITITVCTRWLNELQYISSRLTKIRQHCIRIGFRCSTDFLKYCYCEQCHQLSQN